MLPEKDQNRLNTTHRSTKVDFVAAVGLFVDAILSVRVPVDNLLSQCCNSCWNSRQKAYRLIRFRPKVPGEHVCARIHHKSFHCLQFSHHFFFQNYCQNNDWSTLVLIGWELETAMTPSTGHSIALNQFETVIAKVIGIFDSATKLMFELPQSWKLMGLSRFDITWILEDTRFTRFSRLS